MAAPSTTASTKHNGADRTTRQAIRWATLVALPITVLAGFLIFSQVNPGPPGAAAVPSPTAARPRSSAPVEMAAPRLAQRPAAVCRALVSQLPANLRDLARRPVTAWPEQNTAYGDPALTVACGVPAPSYPSTDDVWVVNGVCWHIEEGDAVLLTTVDREVPIRVRVPRAYPQALQWVAPVSDSVLAAAVPTAKTIPAGCTG